MSKKVTTEDIIRRCKEKHGDTYDYSKVIYKGYSEKIEIICKKHGSFWQDARNHYKLGAGCPICANNIKMDKFVFAEKAKKVHGSVYDYSHVDYVNNKTKVEIICPKHGAFYQSPDKHLGGCGCPKCGVVSRQQTMFAKYGVRHALQSKEIRESMVNKIKRKYHVENVMLCDTIKQAVNESKRKNNTFGRSSTEDMLYDRLVSYYSKDDVVRQYSDKRYPFNCDFYIKSCDLFIELNAFWSHGGHWYNDHNNDDVSKALDWLSKNTELYETCYNVWTHSDVNKRHIAQQNNLNYVVFWDNNLSDADKWFALGCPIGKDYIREYNWL